MFGKRFHILDDKSPVKPGVEVSFLCLLRSTCNIKQNQDTHTAKVTLSGVYKKGQMNRA